MKYRSIAVDGPSGAGKSTLARMLAKSLGYLYVDTGAIYRTVGLAAWRSGISPEDSSAVIGMLPGLSIDLRHGADGLQHMYLDEEDVSEEIRLPDGEALPDLPAGQQPGGRPPAGGQRGRPGLFLRVPDEQSDGYRRAKILMDVFDGQFPVYVTFRSTGKTFRMPSRQWVMLNDVMVEELRRILGAENVVVRAGDGGGR